MRDSSAVAIRWFWPANRPVSRFRVFYCAMPDIGAGIHPVDADDAFEAEQLVQQRYPGDITASLSPSITD